MVIASLNAVLFSHVQLSFNHFFDNFSEYTDDGAVEARSLTPENNSS